MPDPIPRLRRSVREGPSDAPGAVVDALGRIGLVGYGLVHLVVGWLALRVAFGVATAQADADAAVSAVASVPGGLVTLGVGAVGLVAFAIWQLTAAAIGFRWVSGFERVRKRVGAVAKAIATCGLAAVVADYVVGAGRPEGDSTVQELAAALLTVPAGRIVLGAAAVTVLALAAAMTYTGLRRTFLGDLDLSDLGPVARAAIEWLGIAGHLSRALALAMVGVLAGRAALMSDPTRAGGIDAALHALGSTVLGTSVLVVVAVGIAAFGLFCLADAATRRA
ncbi:MAG: DUF1206 domain-containing protein [Pseudonocardia sp.]|nr:DUF1206 domain-containing protein [Pseudonocardia sp.]